MLVLRIAVEGGFTLRMGGQVVTVRLLSVGSGGRATVGIDAPPEVRVLREGLEATEPPASDCGNWSEERQG